jgi:predicted GNAT family acetyltransferase
MGWKFTDDVDSFAREAAPLLRRDPVANTVPLTVLGHLQDAGPAELAAAAPIVLGWYADTDRASGEARGAVVMTPPFELLLAVVPDDTVESLATALRSADVTVPGVNGTSDLVDRFSEIWLSGTTLRSETRLRMRLYALTSLVPPPHPAPGRARLAVEDDTERAVAWFHAFHDEVGAHEPGVEASVRTRIADRRMWLWDDEEGTPVSLAARQRTAAGVARVGPVYTPPDQRGRGYGAAVTAACTADALSDAEQVVLFTDLANPTSNSIYQQIGFRPVVDRRVVAFVD